ncbi:MAG: hypothetical protein BWY70_00524 [Bacteroidetes bacterium ADurb.Bin408]|nr:MAG: hypothetical protein BWY70_00524 [Bacteroidetes bacterium ADurb.Bin408]
MNKRLSVLLPMIIIPLLISAQPWMKDPWLDVPVKQAGYYDICHAFYAYWGNRPYEKGKGYKQFKRWEYHNAPVAFPMGNCPKQTGTIK